MINWKKHSKKGRFLKADDVPEPSAHVRVVKVTEEIVGQDDAPEEKVVVHTVDTTGTALKGLVLNFTNQTTLREAFGDDEAKWVSRWIRLYKMKVQFQGRLVMALRIEAPVEPPTAACQETLPF